MIKEILSGEVESLSFEAFPSLWAFSGRVFAYAVS